MSRPKLPLPLAELVDQRAPARSREMWARVHARVHPPRRLRRVVLGLAASLALACAVLLWGDARWWGAPAAGPLLAAGGRPLPAYVEPLASYAALDFSDGSRVTVARRARLDVLETSGRAVALALRGGRARFDVRPRGPRTWRIDCGPLTVEVVGTAFVLERSTSALEVEVLHGAVLVRGESVPDGVQRLDGGQRLRIQTAAAAQSAPQPEHPVVVEQPSAPELAPSEAAPAAARPPAAPQRARLLVASPAPEPAEPPAADPYTVDVEELLHEADALRLSGRPAAAVAPLQRVIDSAPADARAGLAAFALARLHLGALRDPQRAVRDLERALELGLPAALHEDALAKLAEAQARAGDGVAACGAYERYARHFPGGTKLESLRRRCRVDSPP